MKKKSNFVASILISGLISLIFIAGAGYFVLPLIYPNINEEIETETETPNIVLQSKHIDITTQTFLYDNNLDFEKLNDTELSIITQGDSRIAVLFKMDVIMRVDASFNGFCFYEIVIVIDGIGNRTFPLEYSREPASIIQDHSEDITINYITGVISSDTYTIEVFWRSIHDATGSNSIRSYTVGVSGINFTRTIWAQELRG